MITAQKVYKEMVEMPLKEREKLFSVIAKHGFEKDFYQHDEVFDEIRQSPFTIKEASDYLEVAENNAKKMDKNREVRDGKDREEYSN